MPPKSNPNCSKSQNEEAAEIDAMAGCLFPRDIMIAILSRLPVKSLVRFKCVCKPWYSLVSKPKFIKMHTELSSQSPRPRAVQTHLLACPVLGIHPNRVAPVDAADIWLDHCNGMVCMARPSYTHKIVLWNPATNLWKILPDSSAKFGAVQLVSLGFGCNADGDDFKVVRISCLKGKKLEVGVEVYSSKSDSWRTIEDMGFKFRVMYPKNHVIVNGDPYWIACFAERERENGEVEVAQALLGFDATNMRFKVVALPRVDKLGQGPWPFVNWEGSLAVLACIKKYDNWLQWIDVWCYENGEWSNTRRFLVKQRLQVDQCLDCSRSGKILGGCTNGKLFILDTKSRRIGVSNLKKDKASSFQIFAYDESLSCVKDMTPAGVSHKEQKPEFNDMDGFFVSSFNHSNGQVACYYALE